MALRRFMLKLGLFLGPVLLLLLLPFAFATYTGEAAPLHLVVAMQQREPGLLYYPTDIGTRAFAYKVLTVRQQQPEILVMGSSRATQFRAALVQREGARLYTAGCNYWGVREQRLFLEQLRPENAPDILILSIDQHWFIPGWEPVVDGLTRLRGEMPPRLWFSATRTVLARLRDRSISLETLLQRQPPNPQQTALGLLALRWGDGYRADGSLQWGTILNDRRRIQRGQALGLRWIQEAENTFAWASEVNEDALREISAILDRAAALDIQVIAFTAPFMPSLYEAMMDSGNYRYIPRSNARLQALFAARDVPFHDFSNAAWIGGSDAEMRDASHPSELMSLRIYLELLKAHPDLLGAYSDLDVLSQMLHNAEDPFIVFEP